MLGGSKAQSSSRPTEGRKSEPNVWDVTIFAFRAECFECRGLMASVRCLPAVACLDGGRARQSTPNVNVPMLPSLGRIQALSKQSQDRQRRLGSSSRHAIQRAALRVVTKPSYFGRPLIDWLKLCRGSGSRALIGSYDNRRREPYHGGKTGVAVHQGHAINAA